MPTSDAQHAAEARRAAFDEVLWTELTALRPDFCKQHPFTPSQFSTPQAGGADEPHENKLRELYEIIGGFENSDAGKAQPALSALCLSGGGIRSATFNLGVLQTLAHCGALGKFDYLSSVSGGGYIASWLQAWVHRKGLEPAVRELGDERTDVNPLCPEPAPVDHLREFSNYLTPKLGLFSGDTWTAAAIILRNLLLNWMVIAPLLAALVAIPQGLYLIVQSTVPQASGQALLHAALWVELLASLSVYYHRRFIRDPRHPAGRYLAWCVLPIIAAGGLLSAAALGYHQPFAAAARSQRPWFDAHQAIMTFAVLWCIVVPVLGWLLVELLHWFKSARQQRSAADTRAVDSPRNYYRALWFEFPALIGSGGVAAVLLTAMIKGWYSNLYAQPGLYVMLVLPALLGLYLFTRALFVGAASLSELFARDASPGLMNDGDREWWARLSGWVLVIALAWIAVTGVCLFGQYLLDAATGLAKPAIAAAGGISGALAAFLGSRDKTSGANAGPSLMQKIALMAAAPVFIVCVFIMVSWGTALIGGPMVRSEAIFFNPLQRQPGLLNVELLEFWIVPLACLVLAVLLGCMVNVNHFSLHGLYRNRLVRAYLGASNQERAPDPFTGFDQNDNIRMYRLRPATGPQRLLPIVNLTLNLLRNGKLAWQQRKAESFSVTPYFCGNFHEGYRASQCYGGQGGITLGTAVTISGAAANPHMGYCSSPALGFVMSLFNVRLGAWLGNTNSKGDSTYWLPGPRQALWPMLGELFGFTTKDFKYVNLSDGGHFDNLGLYEVVLRRCRYVVVSDAGCDGDSKFGDLGNAIRKIRIDFGVPIHFEKEIAIFPNSELKRGFYCAIAHIDYASIDGKDAAPGKLLYLKPTLRGRGDAPVPYDVYSYSKTVAEFPHESTADQWFSESQFESYRMLGRHSLQQILKDAHPATLADFFDKVARHVSPPRPPRRMFRPEAEAPALEA